MVVKSCDVVFDNHTFPYGAKLSPCPTPLLAKLPWDKVSPLLARPLGHPPKATSPPEEPCGPSIDPVSFCPQLSTLDKPPSMFLSSRALTVDCRPPSMRPATNLTLAITLALQTLPSLVFHPSRLLLWLW
ncbi:hypothetical protein PCANC_04535 [Puccinia coronata f. sp. avenae]|uniref:Uncharacterized protein n=1 Tax=Puccinia coronata f. sp. avenae TaxID=200324 RepID=A0A2N5VW50_9BASI|nr:hypothetical protein PCANC_04535 [Puccinia coronata f. sp. avenae]